MEEKADRKMKDPLKSSSYPKFFFTLIFEMMGAVVAKATRLDLNQEVQSPNTPILLELPS